MHLVYEGKLHGCYYFPNKLFEYLGSGKPMLYSGGGDIAQLIQEARCGLVTPPGDARAFADAAAYLYDHQEEGRLMGQRGLDYVKRHFDRQKIMTALVEALEGVHNQQNSRAFQTASV
jgi:glycosyltransferase involved in cell wall biosynthesis